MFDPGDAASPKSPNSTLQLVTPATIVWPERIHVHALRHLRPFTAEPRVSIPADRLHLRRRCGLPPTGTRYHGWSEPSSLSDLTLLCEARPQAVCSLLLLPLLHCFFIRRRPPILVYSCFHWSQFFTFTRFSGLAISIPAVWCRFFRVSRFHVSHFQRVHRKNVALRCGCIAYRRLSDWTCLHWALHR